MPKTSPTPEIERETIVETPIRRTDRAIIPAAPREALRIVRGVVMRGVTARHERKVLTTPGVVEAFDEAVQEAAALKRTRE
jgi:hypothetical protein